MRALAIVAATAALLGGVSLAQAENTVGVIKSIDTSKRMVTLDHGMSYSAPKTVKLSSLKVGEKVDVNYSYSKTKMGKGRFDAESIKPLL